MACVDNGSLETQKFEQTPGAVSYRQRKDTKSALRLPFLVIFRNLENGP
jgi:hypothetical protein